MKRSERGKHTPTRSVRMGDRWERLGEVYGERAPLFDQVAAWLLREPGARLPQRAPLELLEVRDRHAS